MKKLLLASLLLLTFAFACKKDEEEVDPRDRFVGTYNAENVMSIPDLQLNESVTGTCVISKEPTAGKIKITSDDGTIQYANVSGNSYVYEKLTTTINEGTITLVMEVTGTGTMNNNIISESGVVKVSFEGMTLTGTWTGTLVKQ